MKRGKGEGAFVELLRRGLIHGSAQKGNRAVKVQGIRSLPMFDGPKIIGEGGVVSMYYHGSKIFCVDLEVGRATDFAYNDYSKSTNANIAEWVRAAIVVFNIPTYLWSMLRWLPRRHDTQATQLTRFRERMPWVKIDTRGVGWFYWASYDENMVDQFNRSQEFLQQDQRHRYMVYDWTERGTWDVRYIDDDAERRYHQREKKRAKTNG